MCDRGGNSVRSGALSLVGVMLALIVLPWPVAHAQPAHAEAAHAQAAHAQGDRVDAIRTALDEDGVYLDSSPALGDPEGWERRLQTAREQSTLGLPVYVALWTEVPGLAPAEAFASAPWAEQRRALGIEDDGLLLMHAAGFPLVKGDLPDGPVGDRVKALGDRADAVADELVAAAPTQFGQITPVAWAWIFFRLAAEDPPTAPDLVAELSGDTSLLRDSSRRVPRPGHNAETLSLSHPAVLVPAGLIILGTVAVFVLMTRASTARTRRPSDQAPHRSRDPLAAGLTDLSLERELTGLAEAIAASQVQPGDPAYDRAQACADAAAQYVDSDRDRDRVGVHLLVEDGHRDLAGQPRRARCFFHPGHHAETSVRRNDAEVPTCRACAAALSAGRRPAALDVEGDDGHVRAYYETADVWTSTGYGALDSRWARRALLAALEAR